MLIKELEDRKLISPPRWLSSNVHYLTIMGSFAYGVSDDTSDCDVYGIAIPPKEQIFPHLSGEILGFGRQKKRFEQWSEHGIVDENALKGHGRNYDFTVYSIVKFFNLAMDANPTIIDSIFVPQNCIIHTTAIGNLIRENRKLFLHKGAFFRYKGYCYSQISKLGNIKENDEISAIRDFEDKHSIPHNTNISQIENELKGNTKWDSLSNLSEEELKKYLEMLSEGLAKSKRFQDRKQNHTDTKFLYHIVRLLNEAEQIMMTGDLDLQQNREQLKSIRKGNWTENEVRQWAADKEKQLEELYVKSEIPNKPDEEKIKKVLIKCLEIQYGDISKGLVVPDRDAECLQKIKSVIEEYNV